MEIVNLVILLIDVWYMKAKIHVSSVKKIISYHRIKNLVKYKGTEFCMIWLIVKIWFTKQKKNV